MNQRKARSKTGRIPSSFDLNTLTTEQRKLHDEITEEWNKACTQDLSLGRKLLAMHNTFVKSGAIKRGGPGSQWTRYLEAADIPKSTAKDYMALAQKRDQAGIPKKAEQYLTRAGVPLDKPKVVDALLAPSLKKKVTGVTCLKDAEGLKPLIMRAARTLPRTSRRVSGAAGLSPEHGPLRESCLNALLVYIQTQPVERRLEELSEICSEVLAYRVQVTIPIGSQGAISSRRRQFNDAA